jgi:hypothetical protein
VIKSVHSERILLLSPTKSRRLLEIVQILQDWLAAWGSSLVVTGVRLLVRLREAPCWAGSGAVSQSAEGPNRPSSGHQLTRRNQLATTEGGAFARHNTGQCILGPPSGGGGGARPEFHNARGRVARVSQTFLPDHHHDSSSFVATRQISPGWLVANISRLLQAQRRHCAAYLAQTTAGGRLTLMPARWCCHENNK